MTKWYVNDLSKLTGVSVQTLHHYDRIDLLKPSIRRTNGYRMYSEQDLLRLQKVIALKFFGLPLKQIKSILHTDLSTKESLVAQSKALEQKAHSLLRMSELLQTTLPTVSDDKSIPWKTIIDLIEVYKMTEDLNNSWLKEIFTPKELNEYGEFLTHLKNDKEAWQRHKTFQKEWGELTQTIQNSLTLDPTSEEGIKLGERCMQIINKLYGTKYAHLRTKKFEQGFGEGKGLQESNLTPEAARWLERATNAYWEQRLYRILDQVGTTRDADVRKLWNTALIDMHGDDESRTPLIYERAVNDVKVSPQAKAWLQRIYAKSGGKNEE